MLASGSTCGARTRSNPRATANPCISHAPRGQVLSICNTPLLTGSGIAACYNAAHGQPRQAAGQPDARRVR